MAEPRRDRQHGPLPGAEQVEDRDAEDLGQLRQLQRADRPSTRLDPRHRRLGQPDPRGQLPLRPALPAASVGDPLTEFVLADSLHLWDHLANIRSYAGIHRCDLCARLAAQAVHNRIERAEQAEGHTAGVAVIVVCILVVLAGLVAVVRWGGLMVEPPHAPAAEAASPGEPPPVGLVVRRYLWNVNLAVAAGVGAGVVAAGAGGGW